jgi:hypothetical protein
MIFLMNICAIFSEDEVNMSEPLFHDGLVFIEEDPLYLSVFYI